MLSFIRLAMHQPRMESMCNSNKEQYWGYIMAGRVFISSATRIQLENVITLHKSLIKNIKWQRSQDIFCVTPEITWKGDENNEHEAVCWLGNCKTNLRNHQSPYH
jgi:hypothetical protein